MVIQARQCTKRQKHWVSTHGTVMGCATMKQIMLDLDDVGMMDMVVVVGDTGLNIHWQWDIHNCAYMTGVNKVFRHF